MTKLEIFKDASENSKPLQVRPKARHVSAASSPLKDISNSNTYVGRKTKIRLSLKQNVKKSLESIFDENGSKLYSNEWIDFKATSTPHTSLLAAHDLEEKQNADFTSEAGIYNDNPSKMNPKKLGDDTAGKLVSDGPNRSAQTEKIKNTVHDDVNTLKNTILETNTEPEIRKESSVSLALDQPKYKRALRLKLEELPLSQIPYIEKKIREKHKDSLTDNQGFAVHQNVEPTSSNLMTALKGKMGCKKQSRVTFDPLQSESIENEQSIECPTKKSDYDVLLKKSIKTAKFGTKKPKAQKSTISQNRTKENKSFNSDISIVVDELRDEFFLKFPSKKKSSKPEPTKTIASRCKVIASQENAKKVSDHLQQKTISSLRPKSKKAKVENRSVKFLKIPEKVRRNNCGGSLTGKELLALCGKGPDPLNLLGI